MSSVLYTFSIDVEILNFYRRDIHTVGVDTQWESNINRRSGDMSLHISQ
jgi:hypothetical protein